MTGAKKRPRFHTYDESVVYDITPKWLVWEAAMHLAAMGCECGYDKALGSGKAWAELCRELERHRRMRKEVGQ